MRGADAASFYEQLVETAPDAMVVVDANGTIVLVNRQVERLLGWRRDQLIGEPMELLVPERARAAHPHNRQAYVHDSRTRPMGAGLELTAAHANGSEIAVDISLSPLELGGDRFVSAAIRDASDRKRAEADLRSAHDRLAVTVGELEAHRRELELVNEMGDLLQNCLTVDEAHQVIAHCAALLFPGAAGAVFHPATGTGSLEAVKTWGSPGPPTQSVFAIEDCWALRRGRVHGAWDDTAMLCGHLLDPSERWAACLPMIAQGEVLGLLHVAGPLTDAPQRNRRSVERVGVAIAEHLSLAVANLRLRETLRTTSIRDHLTGLFNRRFLDDQLERALLQSRRSASPTAVAMVDIDHFKAYNDALGHAAGDAALVRVASILSGTARANDLVCRQGGEEFVIVMPDTDLPEAARRAEQLCAACASAFESDTRPPLTVSVGLAAAPTDGQGGATLLAAADAALYEAKRSGRNRVVSTGDRRPGTGPLLHVR